MSRPVSPVDYARAFSHRGEALLDLGLHAEALLTFERALGFDPMFVAAHIGRAKTLVAMHQYQAALLIYQQLKKDFNTAKLDPSMLDGIEQAIHTLQANAPIASSNLPTSATSLTSQHWLIRAEDLARGMRVVASFVKMPLFEAKWYQRAVPVLGVAISAAFLSPWLEDEAIRQGWIQAVDGQSIRADAEGPSTGASVSKLEADSASGPASTAGTASTAGAASTAGTAAASGSASVASTAKRLSSERPNDPAVTSESAQQIADAAFTGATTLRYRPLAVPSSQRGQLQQGQGMTRGHRPLDRIQREQIANYIVEQFGSKQHVARAVVQEAVIVGKQLQLDPLLLLAIIAVESRFDPMAQSPKGAQGLMQVRTAVHSARFDPFGGVAAAFDFATNIRIGAQILQEHLSRHGSVDLALKHYVGAARMAHDQGYAAKVRKEKSKLEQVWTQGAAAESHQVSMR